MRFEMAEEEQPAADVAPASEAEQLSSETESTPEEVVEEQHG